MTIDARTNGNPDDIGVEELFQTAALILADQEEAVAAFERAVLASDIDLQMAPVQVYRKAREVLTQFAIERAVALDPLAFKPETPGPISDVCLDTDDWEATGLTAKQLTELVSGTGRTRLRDWLEHLRPASRVIFVLRAILGKDSRTVAAALDGALGAGALGAGRPATGVAVWTSEQVGYVFRGALCSLATSLVHAPAAS